MKHRRQPSWLAALNRDASSGSRLSHAETTPFGPGAQVERWRMANGLQILLAVDRGAPVVSFHTWVRVGSRHEEPGRTGLAHFLEHLMFHETERLPSGAFDRQVEQAGGETNAETWVDWTHYYISVPSEALAMAIELEAERFARLRILPEQVESEREVVANERRMAVDDNLQGFAGEALHRIAYGSQHPHGWPTIGWMADIEGYTAEACERFYRTWYVPNNATLVASGDFEPEDALRWIQQAYADAAPAELPSRPVGPPERAAGSRVTIPWPTETHKLFFGFHAPAYGSDAYAPTVMVQDILAGGRSARLYRRLVEELEWATDVSASVAPLAHAGLFELSVSVRQGVEVEGVVRVLDEELQRLSSEPARERELMKVRNRGELFALSELETAEGKASSIGFSDTLVGDPAHVFTFLDELQRIDGDRIAATARALFAGRTEVQVKPSDEGGSAQ